MPSTNTKNYDINYTIKSVERLKFDFTALELLNIENLDLEKIDVKFQQSFSLKEDIKIISIDLGTLFTYEEEVKLVEFRIRINYFINEFNLVTNKRDTNKLQILNQIMIHLVGLTLSTSRGMLASYLIDTDYKNIFIPILQEQDIRAFFLPDFPKLK
ncbi:hypothetical protein [Chitinophaga sp.]|uniref:hypothetical protein n=1 Tax=Chitinophaga sp. TaxID=1869181 RepID=UPI0031D6BC84